MSRTFAVIPEILHRFPDVDDAVWTDQLDEHVLGIAAERVRDFGNHRLDRECMWNIRDRAEPADPRMRGCFRILAAYVWDRKRYVDKSLPELDRRLVFRARHELDMKLGAALR